MPKFKNIIPADHSITAETLGIFGLIKMIFKAGFAYRHTMIFFLKKGRFKELFNFFYTKTLVPTGEGSGELAYYFIGRPLQKFPTLAPYPRYIEVEMTSRCNKRCIICEHTWWQEPAADLSLADFIHLTDQFNLRWINMTGEGDAFLNKDYLNMIRHVKKRGTSVYLVDSFDLITKDIARELVRSGVDGIYISMDGAKKETYESIKVGCNFDKVVSNIRNLLEIKRELRSPIPEICFRFVINSLNADQMPDYVKLIRSLGPRQAWGDGSKIHFAGLLNYPEVNHLYMETIPREYINATVQSALSDPDNLPVVFAHTEPAKNPSIDRCLAWMEPYFALVPHQMVLPCCAVLMSNSRAFLEEYSFGDYTKIPMKDIWNSPYYRWFRRAVNRPDAPVPAMCRGCRAYDTTERTKKCGIDFRKRTQV
jgi:MoaA/NifB/PqqE/SkfB family radical SAM enzyme